MSFRGTQLTRSKTVIEGKVIEKMNSFIYLRFNDLYLHNKDVRNKLITLKDEWNEMEKL